VHNQVKAVAKAAMASLEELRTDLEQARRVIILFNL
jgi:hypothetical protein